MTETTAVIDTAMTRLGLVFSSRGLRHIELQCRKKPTAKSRDKTINAACKELQDYLSGKNVNFDITLDPQGTPFQKSVWRVLKKIKPGEVRTYGDIAAELKTSPRAVGNACRKNPLPIIVPCHRVVSKAGIGGYAGATEGTLLDMKTRLLAHEQSDFL